MKGFKFHRLGVQVKKTSLTVSTNSDGSESISLVVPTKEAEYLRGLIKEGYHIFTAMVWTCPDKDKGC